MLKELSEAIGVSGGEQKVKELISEFIVDDVAEIFEDAYGNLIVKKQADSTSDLLIAAHMDEVGFMITGVSTKGHLHFRTIGIMPHVLLAKHVVVGNNEISGVIGHKPIHHSEAEELKKLPDQKKLFIDIGVSSKEEALKHVSVGDHGTFRTTFREFDHIVYGKAFDNRIGCYVLIQLIKTTDFPIYYAFTTQEEAGLRGAQIVGHRLGPKVVIAVDTTASGEWPVEHDLPAYPEIGKGSVISVTDRSVICDRTLVSLLEDTAEQHGIPYQYKKPMIGGTDAGPIHLSRGGCRAAVVQTPARYIHSPMSIASRKDIEAEIKLLTHGIERMLNEEALWN